MSSEPMSLDLANVVEVRRSNAVGVSQHEKNYSADSGARQAASTPLDVIYILNSLAVGGSERKTVRIANGLTARGLNVGIAYLNSPDSLLKALDAGVAVFDLRRRGKFSLGVVWRLRRIIASSHPAAVVGVNLYPTLYMAASTALLGRRRQPRTLCLINTASAGGMPQWRRWLYARLMRGVDWTVHGCENYRRLWVGSDSRTSARSGVIYNGVDVTEFQPETLQYSREQARALYGVAAERFVIGTVGRLSAEKNQMLLIDVLARLRWSGMNAHVLLAGDGTLRASLAARAAKLGLAGRVTFTGALDDVRPALTAMDVFVLPSVGVETFSNAALEAMALAKPVILADIGGAAEMIDDGKEGFIVPPEELASRLPALLTQLYADNRRRQAMGAAARAKVVERFSVAEMVDRHLTLIQKRR